MIKIPLREVIELVIVTAGAADGQPQVNRSGGVNPIDDRLDTILLGVAAALLVELCVAMKPGGDLLIDRRTRQHVAGNLFDRKLIERHVRTDRVDHPIAIPPNAAGIVVRISVRVGVTGQIEPVPRPALGELRRSEQPIYRPLVSIGTIVGQE